MYDEAADHFLVALKFIPDWFVTSKMIKKTQMMVKYFLMQVLVISYFVLMKWIFLV